MRKAVRGSFDNYVDQISPNFDPSSGQTWTFYISTSYNNYLPFLSGIPVKIPFGYTSEV